MSRRPRKSNRELCSASTIEEARIRIRNGESKRKVALSLGMAESTLRHRLQQTQCATKLGRFNTTFSTEIEEDFCAHLRTLDEMFYGMTAKDLRKAAYEFAEKHKMAHRFNKEAKMAGKEWLRGFMKRHPDIALRQPTSTSIARATGFNRPQVERFYIQLSAIMDKYNFPPQSIFNMDETGISTVPNRPLKVLSTKGKRAVNKIASAERGTNVTVVSAVSATGHYLPPAFIFGRKRMKAELIDGAPPGSIGMISDSSFINSDLFMDWLSHFRDHTRPSAQHPVLLILDNHVSHCSIKAVDFYRQNNIVALTLPPHSSHKMQPLDRGFHGALKKYYAHECEKWLRNHPGRAITTFQVASIFTPAFNKAATVDCGVESFKSTGIYPWNPDVFTDADFMASAVTERDNPETEAPEQPKDATTPELMSQHDEVVNVIISPTKAVTDCSNQTPIESSSKGTDENMAGCSKQLKTFSSSKTTESDVPLEPAPSASTQKNDAQSPSLRDVVPIPKSDVKRCSNRKRKRSEIISSSPYKAQLIAEEQQKTGKRPNKIAGYGKKTKKEFKKPQSSKNKKIWRCGGCSEVFKEPIVEDWIECHTCQVWWHEKCSNYLGFGHFKCDLCVN